MAPASFLYTTGPSPLPDIGSLYYNGCLFSPLYETRISGVCVKDEAQRTIKYIEYTITADGYVTLPDGMDSTAPVMTTLRNLLTQQGGELIYTGRGCDIHVNSPALLLTGVRDVSWGPVPELLEFQPLGAGRSAKIKWEVKVRIPEIKKGRIKGRVGGVDLIQLLQFNYETIVSYSEDGYSTLTMRGTMEIPLTRTPNQLTRKLAQTVDDMRIFIEANVMDGIDLTRFRLTRRDINISRDKRIMEWTVVAEEQPYMQLPPNCTLARGTFNVRPAKAGMGLALWLCTLRATYTVRRSSPGDDSGARRIAWMSFLSLLRLRMNQSATIDFIKKEEKIDNILKKIAKFKATNRDPKKFPDSTKLELELYEGFLSSFERELEKAKDAAIKRICMLIDFNFDEGLYLDSKYTTFSATWRLNVHFEYIMLASGLWKKLPEETDEKPPQNLWKISMKDINGMSSWLPNKIDPDLDVIVDFGY